MRRLFMLAAAAAIACACAATPVSPADAPPELGLPRDVRPLRYALELTLSPERDRFQGEVAIDVEVRHPTARIWLHARDLTVSGAWVEAAGERTAATLAQVTDGGVARLTPERAIPAGHATLHFAFDGAWNDGRAGLCRVRSGGASYAYTQLDAMEARRIFPGFDEPAFKTPFDVTLVVPEDAVAVSNAPTASEEKMGAGMKRVRFEGTAPLPTYLVFAGVGPFDVVTPAPLPPNEVRAHALPIRALAPRGTGRRLAFALEATRAILPILERWFGIAFPYQKLDQVVSTDIAFAGMESAGAILYRDERLAFEAGRSPEQSRIAVGRLVAHELALQWVGDLVTPEGWEDAWLNESFATFMAWKAVDAWRPDAHEPEEAATAIDAALEADALPSARALRQPLQRGGDVSSQLDRLPVKGAALLRSFERLMGEGRFREGIRAYLRANAHGTGTTGEVLAELSRAAGRELGPAFRSFLDQPGTPLVVANTVCGAGEARIELAVTRERPIGSGAASGGVFAVPVCARYEAAGTLGEACTLVERGRGTLALPACPRWVMPAAGGTACYRWALGSAPQGRSDKENGNAASLGLTGLARLRDAGLLHLTAAERLSYAQSLRAGARAGRLPYGDALLALAPLARDGVRRVATSPMPALEQAIDHLVPDDAHLQARARAADLFRPRLRDLGLDPIARDPLDARGLRGDLADFLVQVAHDPETTRALAALGRAYASLGDGHFHDEAVSPDLARTALSAAVIEGDVALFDALEKRLHATDDGEQRGRILAALGSARTPALSARALALAGDPRLRTYERARTLFAQASYSETRVAAWKALQGHWRALVQGLNPGLADALPSVAEGLCDRTRIPAVARFLAPRVDDSPGARRHLREAVDSIELCAALRDAQGASAAAYFGARP
jgi:alanyl aminopeptidase